MVGEPVIADFGAATTVDTSTHSATMALTVLYAAPEVLEGASATERSDQYSLALTLLAAATGRHPFGGSEGSGLASLVNQICTTGVDDPAALDVPAGLAAVLARATSLGPETRYPDAGAFADALAQVATDPSVVPTGAGRPKTRPTRRSVRRPGVLAVAVASLAVLGGAVAFAVNQGDDGADAQPNRTKLARLGDAVTRRNGIMGPLYQQDDITYVGMLDKPCANGQRYAELSTHAGPADLARSVPTPWEAVKGDGVGVFMAWMPCDTKIHEARFKLGATGRWFVYVAQFPEDQYNKMVAAMRTNENSPAPDYTVDEDVLATLANPDVYKGWAIIDRPA